MNSVQNSPVTQKTDTQNLSDYCNTYGFKIKIKPVDNDVFTSNNQKINKEDKSKKAVSVLGKIAVSATLITAGVIGTVLLASKGYARHIKRLYNEKLILSNLAPDIKFQPATTLDDALKFTKETLKIKTIDKDFSLEALNFINKGLSDVSNTHKGKLFMPTALRYSDMGDKTIAGVVREIRANNFGEMRVNKRFFDEKVLNEHLGIKPQQLAENIQKVATATPQTVKSAQTPIEQTVKKAQNLKDFFSIVFSCEANTPMAKLVEKRMNNPELLTLVEKRELTFAQIDALSKTFAFLDSPLRCLKVPGIIEKLKNAGIQFDLNEFSKLPVKVQEEQLLDAFNKANFKGKIKAILASDAPIKSIYHEMGHLQDYGKNLKELDVKNFDINIKQIFKDAWAGKKSRVAIDAVRNRWGGLTYDGYKELFENNPSKFQEIYPDLYEFLTNATSQETASKVSQYSMSSISEFIAETYAELVKGKSLPNDVMALYNKYNGPLPA